MRKRFWLLGVFLAVFVLLSVLKITGLGGDFLDLADTDEKRYHPNGSEPVYVGIFGG